MKTAYLLVEVTGEDSRVEKRVREILGMWQGAYRIDNETGKSTSILNTHIELCDSEQSAEMTRLLNQRERTTHEMIHSSEELVK